MSRSRFFILPAAVALLVGVQACDPGDNTVHEHPDNVRHGGGAGAKAGGSGGSLTAAGASGGGGALGGRAGAGGASGVGGAGGAAGLLSSAN